MTDEQTQIAAAAEGQVRLRPPRHRVSRRAIAYWTVRALIGWMIFAALQIVWWILGGGFEAIRTIAIVVTAVVAIAHLLVMPQWRFRVHRWEATSEAVYTQSGWFDVERRIAPLSRIQTVDSERGPLEQVFGLTNVQVTTASAAGPLKIHGLDRTTAQDLVDELTTATQAEQGDAT